MASIYNILQGLKPTFEEHDLNKIITRYAANAGVKDKDEAKYFDQLWKPFAWAAIIGFINDKQIPLEGTKKSAFSYETIYTNGEDIFYSLVLFAVEKKGYEILSDTQLLNNTISEYANGGFELIYTTLKDKGDDYFSDANSYLEELIERE
jgi:hypothetical protein